MLARIIELTVNILPLKPHKPNKTPPEKSKVICIHCSHAHRRFHGMLRLCDLNMRELLACYDDD